MVRKLLSLILLLVVACSIGSQGVYFEEMASVPTVKLKGNTFTVTTSNSVKNSALSIYCVNVSVDQVKKELYLSAEQAIGKEIKNNFVIELENYKIDDVSAYVFYWIDPDKSTTKLAVTIIVN